MIHYAGDGLYLDKVTKQVELEEFKNKMYVPEVEHFHGFKFKTFLKFVGWREFLSIMYVAESGQELNNGPSSS